VNSDSDRIIEHKHKATGCKQRLYVSIHRCTDDVLRYEKKQGRDYVARGLVASLTFTIIWYKRPILADICPLQLPLETLLSTNLRRYVTKICACSVDNSQINSLN